METEITSSETFINSKHSELAVEFLKSNPIYGAKKSNTDLNLISLNIIKILFQ